MNRVVALLGFLFVVGAAAIFGSLATIDAADQYALLDQPSWAPPGWLFGPVWTLLYAAIAVAAWRVHGIVGSLRAPEMAWFGAQLLFNAVWSPLFFAFQLRGFALAWIIALDVLVAVTLWRFWRQDRVAGILFVPYLAWVLFATGLNAAVWWLNRA